MSSKVKPGRRNAERFFKKLKKKILKGRNRPKR